MNWDPVEQTVLANEQVIDGKGWRSGVEIERKKLSQWFFKITDFGNELLDGLTQLPKWPDEFATLLYVDCTLEEYIKKYLPSD